jgi:hypothetical protein
MKRTPYTVGNVDISDGLHDELRLISASLVDGEPVGLFAVGVTIFAALSSAYLGIQVLRLLGAKSDLGYALGAVVGSVALDVGGRLYTRRVTNNG